MMIHIVGPHITIGPYLRQRCAWCGATLLDYNLDRIAVPVGQDPRPATWPVGGLLGVEGVASWVVEHEDGALLPEGCCALLDPAVTA